MGVLPRTKARHVFRIVGICRRYISDIYESLEIRSLRNEIKALVTCKWRLELHTRHLPRTPSNVTNLLCQLLELFAASVEVRVQPNAMSVKAEAGELSFVKCVTVLLADSANGLVRRKYSATNVKAAWLHVPSAPKNSSLRDDSQWASMADNHPKHEPQRRPQFCILS